MSVATVHRRRAVLASTVGTTIEWYDFFLYNTAASLIFPALFFPHQAAFTGILLSFGTQFVGFAARPVGAAIFGHYGDRIGRKATRRRSCSPCCGSARASGSAASGAARCCSPWSGARRAGAA
jgi:MFS family permease